MNHPAPADLSANDPVYAIIALIEKEKGHDYHTLGDIDFAMQIVAALPGLGYTRLAADEVVCKRRMLNESAESCDWLADFLEAEDLPEERGLLIAADEERRFASQLRAKAGEGNV